MIYINEELINNQRNVIKMLIRKVGNNIVQGKSIMNVSLPTIIFSKTTMLMRQSEMIQFIPKYVKYI